MDRNILLNFHKVKPATFGNITKKREVESNRLKNDRHARRTDRFNSRRNMGNEEDSKLNRPTVKEVPKKIPAVEASKVVDRKLALQKFKREKEALQIALKKNVRPPFKVGIPHHGSSPLLRDLTNHDCLTNQHRPVSQEFTFKPKKVESVKKLTSPHTPTVLKRSARKNVTLLTNPSRRNIVVESSLNKSTSSTNGEMLAEPLPEVETDATSPVQPQHYQEPTIIKCTEAASNETTEFVLSPDVENQRRRQLRKRSSAKMPLPESQSTGPGVVQNPAAEFHRNRLDDETSRLLSLAELWEPFSLQPKIPREIIDEIDSLVGQTRLLTRDKLKQFRGLVDQFESGATTAASVHPITVDDLHGFWEMMYLQVEHLIKRYDELESLKNNNWVKAKAPTPPKKKRRIAMKPKGTPRATAALRAAMRAGRTGPEQDTTTSGQTAALRAAMRAGRTRPEQVTTTSVIQDSRKTPTTDQTSVVNSLLSSATRPRNSHSPYIVMRLSGMGRSTIVGMDSPDHSKVEAVEIENNDEDFGLNSIFELQEHVSEATFVKTPRRSLRLLGKTPTSMKGRLCGTCLSPQCDSEEQGKENIRKRLLRKSRRTCKFNLSPLEQKQIGDDTATALGVHQSHEDFNDDD